jgi:hypothetical protein
LACAARSSSSLSIRSATTFGIAIVIDVPAFSTLKPSLRHSLNKGATPDYPISPSKHFCLVGHRTIKWPVVMTLIPAHQFDWQFSSSKALWRCDYRSNCHRTIQLHLKLDFNTNGPGWTTRHIFHQKLARETIPGSHLKLALVHRETNQGVVKVSIPHSRRTGKNVPFVITTWDLPSSSRLRTECRAMSRRSISLTTPANVLAVIPAPLTTAY